jgi:hypothetical protein
MLTLSHIDEELQTEFATVGFSYAIRDLNYIAIKNFIEAGAYVDATFKTPDGKKVALDFVIEASFNDNIENIFKLLLDNGANLRSSAADLKMIEKIIIGDKNKLYRILLCDGYFDEVPNHDKLEVATLAKQLNLKGILKVCIKNGLDPDKTIIIKEESDHEPEEIIDVIGGMPDLNVDI